jgi:ribonuclease HI
MKKASIITTASYNAVIDKGAYGCILLTPDKDVPLGQCYIKTTAPRLELYAVVRALEEIEKHLPGESLEIEISSKLTYITLSFAGSEMRKKLLKGESLPNYDLWKRIFDLGVKHKWRVVPVKQNPIIRYHEIAQKIAAGALSQQEGIEDPGLEFSTRRKKPTAQPVFRDEDLADTKSAEEYSTTSNPPVKRDDMPIIENNDPPF